METCFEKRLTFDVTWKTMT